ncbi:Pre-mRNA-splicing factor cwf16 [Neolecta irregularis DAH-3]|uniref:Pre-mRNA-splicing factor cwf16 n=1 Tax=Neolecta irregularis (strain DAH-3) TaxID=1198029 RepID=A0A1U7LJW7_NEOID|nr:Pre-mRNA-splicing factor cwf16 [Neolecta irregularis DAH-3]|eukprot:OLL22883.1 Pre-mRNA-splicing factor cwf16 [Neolecta irregularis DAH-3]
MRCNSCGEYIYKGKKFNARKEHSGEAYMSISIFRFYIRCTRCSAEITFKTDPKNADYTAERGASRNFEPWREQQKEEEEDKLARLAEEEENAMTKLENKTTNTKREMEIMDALDDIRTRNARNERIGVEGAVRHLESETQRSAIETEEDRLNRQDAEIAKTVFDKTIKTTITPTPAKSSIASFKKPKAKKPKQNGVALGIVLKKTV